MVYTMDYEVVLEQSKSNVGCWTRVGTASVYAKETNGRLRSQKDMFQGLNNPLTWSNGLCGERGKRGIVVGKIGAYCI